MLHFVTDSEERPQYRQPRAAGSTAAHTQARTPPKNAPSSGHAAPKRKNPTEEPQPHLNLSTAGTDRSERRHTGPFTSAAGRLRPFNGRARAKREWTCSDFCIRGRETGVRVRPAARAARAARTRTELREPGFLTTGSAGTPLTSGAAPAGVTR